jgi:diguanylate cyclase (GGDEF)-like protein
MQVLIVEDDAMSRRILQRSVERLGHQCLLAEDGEEAFDLYTNNHPEVIISDWVMPKMDGLTLCRKIRDIDEQAYPYFIVITSKTEQSHRLEGMEAGADDYLMKPLDTEDLHLRLVAAQRVTTLHQRLFDQAKTLKQLNEQYYEDGRRDTLTGIGNRRRMEEDLERQHWQAVRYKHGYAIVLIDIDRFKAYNDSCGHEAGNTTLRAVATSMSNNCRRGDAVYRYGGEEFLALLPREELQEAIDAAERMRLAILSLEIPHPGLDPEGFVSVSAGIATFHFDEDLEYSEIIERADRALYQAKDKGRNQVVAWEQNLANT